jgi:hypothetical protein
MEDVANAKTKRDLPVTADVQQFAATLPEDKKPQAFELFRDNAARRLDLADAMTAARKKSSESDDAFGQFRNFAQTLQTWTPKAELAEVMVAPEQGGAAEPAPTTDEPAAEPAVDSKDEPLTLDEFHKQLNEKLAADGNDEEPVQAGARASGESSPEDNAAKARRVAPDVAPDEVDEEPSGARVNDDPRDDDSDAKEAKPRRAYVEEDNSVEDDDTQEIYVKGGVLAGVRQKLRDAMLKPSVAIHMAMGKLIGKAAGASAKYEHLKPEQKRKIRIWAGIGAAAVVGTGAVLATYAAMHGHDASAAVGDPSVTPSPTPEMPPSPDAQPTDAGDAGGRGGNAKGYDGNTDNEINFAAKTHVEELDKGDNIWNHAEDLYNNHGYDKEYESVAELKNKILDMNGISESEARHMAIGEDFKVPGLKSAAKEVAQEAADQASTNSSTGSGAVQETTEQSASAQPTPEANSGPNPSAAPTDEAASTPEATPTASATATATATAGQTGQAGNAGIDLSPALIAVGGTIGGQAADINARNLAMHAEHTARKNMQDIIESAGTIATDGATDNTGKAKKPIINRYKGKHV